MHSTFRGQPYPHAPQFTKILQYQHILQMTHPRSYYIHSANVYGKRTSRLKLYLVKPQISAMAIKNLLRKNFQIQIKRKCLHYLNERHEKRTALGSVDRLNSRILSKIGGMPRI